MAFGDVNLSEDQVRGKFAGSPGGGGWPTIRVYNKATGYDGAFAGDWKVRRPPRPAPLTR